MMDLRNKDSYTNLKGDDYDMAEIIHEAIKNKKQTMITVEDSISHIVIQTTMDCVFFDSENIIIKTDNKLDIEYKYIQIEKSEMNNKKYYFHNGEGRSLRILVL